MGAYDNLIAGGVDTLTAYTPEDLFAGPGEAITEPGTVAAGQNLSQFQVISLDANGYAVAWTPATHATGVITFSNTGTANDTVTINGVEITMVASGATGNQINIGASATLTAQALKDFVNANTTALGVTASGAAAAITLTANTPGFVGNSITTTESGTGASFGAATLTGGKDYDRGPVGVLQLAVNASSAAKQGTWWISGRFNHEKLAWPSSLSTLALRKKAIAGATFSVDRLL